MRGLTYHFSCIDPLSVQYQKSEARLFLALFGCMGIGLLVVACGSKKEGSAVHCRAFNLDWLDLSFRLASQPFAGYLDASNFESVLAFKLNVQRQVLGIEQNRY